MNLEGFSMRITSEKMLTSILTVVLAEFLRVMEIRGSHGILRFHFQDLESHGM